MKKTSLLVLALLFLCIKVYAVLPPWENEIKRMKSSNVIYGQVINTTKGEETRAGYIVTAQIKAIHIFKTEDALTTGSIISATYEKMTESRKMTIGGRTTYEFKIGDKGVFFIAPNQTPSLVSYTNDIKEIEIYKQILELYMLPDAERYSPDHIKGRVTNEELYQEQKMYKEILGCLK